MQPTVVETPEQFEDVLEQVMVMLADPPMEGTDEDRALQAKLAALQAYAPRMRAVPPEDPRAAEIARLLEAASALESRVASRKSTLMGDVDATLSPIFGRGAPGR